MTAIAGSSHKKATPVEASVASIVAPQTGFEPVASSSAGKRSNPLSYWGVWRGGRDLNPRGSYSPPTHLAGGRTRPCYATSPRAIRGRTSSSSPASRLFPGGGRGIRTPGDVAATAVFKTAAIVRSAIPPRRPSPARPASLPANNQSIAESTVHVKTRDAWGAAAVSLPGAVSTPRQSHPPGTPPLRVHEIASRAELAMTPQSALSLRGALSAPKQSHQPDRPSRRCLRRQLQASLVREVRFLASE
jgi:hypothetical protein